MSEQDIDGQWSNVAEQIFDVSVNPLMGMLCSFLALQIRKGLISKDEAKGVIVSALDLINQTDHATDVLQNGHEMLLRMINAIEKIPAPPPSQTPS